MRRPDPFETEMFIEDLQAAEAAGMANPMPQQQIQMPSPVSPQFVPPTPPVMPETQPMPSAQQVNPLQDAQSARDRMLKYSMLLRGFQDVLKGATGANVNYGTADALAQQAMLPIEDVKLKDQMKRQAAQEKRAEKQLSLQEKADIRAEKGELRAQEKFVAEQRSMSQALEKGEMDLEIARQANDPQSTYSDIAREYATKYLKIDPEKVKDLSANQLMSISKPIQEMILQEMKARMQAQLLENQQRRIEQAERRLEQHDTKEKRLREQFGDRKVQKFADDAYKAIDRLRKTETWKSAERVLAEVPTIEALVNDAYTKGGQSLAMLGPRIAKGIAGEVGVLTEQDVTRYVQNPALVPGMMDTLAKMKSGKLSGASRENILRLLDIMKKNAEDKRQMVIYDEAVRFARTEGMDDVRDALYFLDSAYKAPKERIGTKTDEYAIKEIRDVPEDYPQPGESKLKPEDKKAVDWAKANRDDPRAQQILKIHGLQ